MSDTSKFELPSDPAERKKIKDRLSEIAAQEQMAKDRKDSINDIKDDLKDSFQMPRALVNKLVKALNDDKYVEMTEENSIFELVRETLLGDAGLPDDNEEDNV